MLGVTIASLTYDGGQPTAEAPNPPTMTGGSAHNFERIESLCDTDTCAGFGFQ